MDNEPDAPLEEAVRLRNDLRPPAMLESRVIATLRADGLIRARAGWSWPARIAASFLLFVAGAIMGRYATMWQVAPQPTPIQSRYLLLLAGDVTPAAAGSSRAEEYAAWARSLAARGIKVSGDELTSFAEVVGSSRAASFPDLASVGGYFLIEASDDAAAAALARTCPHVKYGGSILVRRVIGS